MPESESPPGLAAPSAPKPPPTEVSLLDRPVYTGFMAKLLKYMAREDIQSRLKGDVLDPLINHILRRVFPYIILTCVLFVLLLISVLLTLGIIILQNRSPGVGVVPTVRAT
jgi:hypothetical protein